MYPHTLVLFCISPILGASPRNMINYGVVFEPQPTLYSSSEYWTHTFVIDTLPSIALQHHRYRCTCPDYKLLFDKLSALHSDTIKVASGISKNIIELLDDVSKADPQEPTRSRRASVPFLKHVSKKGKGRSISKEFADELAIHIEEITNKTSQLEDEFTLGNQQFTSFRRVSNKKMAKALRKIDENHKLLIDMDLQLERNLSNIQKLQAWVMSVLLEQFEYHSEIRTAYNKLLEGVVMLINGHVSPLILDYSYLGNVIQEVSSSVLRQRSGRFLIHQHVSYYYKHTEYAVHQSNSKIFITLKFPIAKLNQPFELYKINTFPIPIQASDHASVISKQPEYFAMSSTGRHYAFLTNADLDLCTHDHQFIHCHSSIAVSSVSNNHCVLALYNGNRNDVFDFCEFRVLAFPKLESVIHLNDSYFLFINTSSLTLECDDEEDMDIACAFCLINISCRCAINSERYSIAKRSARCVKRDSSYDVTYPYNLIFVQKYFGKYSFPNMLANSTMNNSLKVSANPITFYNHPMLTVVANDRIPDLNIDKVINTIKANEPVYIQMADKLLDISLGYHNMSYIIVAVAVSIFISILSLCVVSILFIIFIKSQSKLCMLKNVHSNGIHQLNLEKGSKQIYTDLLKPNVYMQYAVPRRKSLPTLTNPTYTDSFYPGTMTERGQYHIRRTLSISDTLLAK